MALWSHFFSLGGGGVAGGMGSTTAVSGVLTKKFIYATSLRLILISESIILG